MATMTMASREPIATGVPLASGYRRSVTLDGVAFTLEVTRHEAPDASAPWRRPRAWCIARVTSEHGGLRYEGRVHAASPAEAIMRIAGLAFECPSCREIRGLWLLKEASGCCPECHERVGATIARHHEEREALAAAEARR